jgi:hypothetical protein
MVTIRDVTRTAVAMEQLSKHVFAATNSRNKRRAVFLMWSAPQPLLRNGVQTRLLNNRKAVFCAWSLTKGYKKDKEDRLRQSSFETPSCQDMSLGAEELK